MKPEQVILQIYSCGSFSFLFEKDYTTFHSQLQSSPRGAPRVNKRPDAVRVRTDPRPYLDLFWHDKYGKPIAAMNTYNYIKCYFKRNGGHKSMETLPPGNYV
jgi:hypothetical protein